MSAGDTDLYAVGRVVKPFGVKGEVVLLPLTEDPGRFRTLRKVLVGRTPGTAREARLEATDIRRGGVRVRLSVSPDRTAAEALVGAFVFVAPSERRKLPQGTYFTHQIVGLVAVNESGEELGRVREVMKLPAHDVYVIDGRGREILLPAVREFVGAIDLAQGIIHVRLIEGMDEQ